jgi:hypothetical protein
MISSHAVKDTSSTATFALVDIIVEKRSIALLDSGSTDTFMEYTFGSQLNLPILTTTPKKVKVVGGGSLDLSAVMQQVTYSVQREVFTNDFKLLHLRGYGIILGCDRIKTHSHIGLDLREPSRQLIIQKQGAKSGISGFYCPSPQA